MRTLRNLLPRKLGVAHYLYLFAFLARLIVLARLASSALLLPGESDMHFYDNWAQRILHGQLTDHFAFYGLPMYAYVLAILYKLAGYNPFVPGILQAALDAGTALLIYKITLLILSEKKAISENVPTLAGILAALGWVFFSPAQSYSVILMPTAGLVFAFWFLVWRAIKDKTARRLPLYFYFGLVAGFVATGVASILVLLPLLMARIWRDHSRDLRRALAGAALLFTGVILGASPCWLHNYFVADDPVFLSAHGGINFWLGNNPQATGYPNFPNLSPNQSELLTDSIHQAEAAAGHPLKRSAVSVYWSTKARAFIAQDFSTWLNLLGRKAINLTNAFEYDDLGVISNMRAEGITWPGLHFGLIEALAVPGFFFGLLALPRSRWIAAANFLQLLAVLPTFVTERYRLAMVPGLLIFAAIGICCLWESCLRKELVAVSGYIILAVAAAWLVSVPMTNPALWALKSYNAGRQALESHDLERATKELELAYTYVPTSAETNFALGNLRFAQGDANGARAFYTTSLQFDARHKGALNNLGVLALENHDWPRAAGYFRAGLQIAPNESKTHFLLARAEWGLQEKALALTEINSAIQLKPEQAEYLALREMIQNQP